MAKGPKFEDNKSLWIHFAQDEILTDSQCDLFKRYADLLISWNKKVNLTAITNMKNVVTYHFKDSLYVADIINMQSITHCADIGSGAGFPGIALAIKHPHLLVTLIEVNAKKIRFLDTVITELNLTDRVSVFDEDWRTFLRTTNEDIQLFCARASLQPEELIRMFKPACPYKDAPLVYWASELWQPSKYVVPYLVKEISYRVGKKQRRLILLKAT